MDSNMDMTSNMDMDSLSSMIMSSISSMVMSSMSSMLVDQSHSMSASHSGSMAMEMSMPASSSTMDMAMSASSSSMSMDMPMATSGASSSSSSSMEGMEGMSGMHMNYYLTRKFDHYPVLFEKLYATSKKDAFGIFVLILAACFVYKLILFVSWCLEVHWFKKWDNTKKNLIMNTENSENDTNYDSDMTEIGSYHDNNGVVLGGPLPKLPNLMYDIFAPNWIDLTHDFLRIILIFISTMIIYMLMLAAMSFVLTYVFAVITGLTLSEVFFNKCKMAMLKRWDIQRQIQKINSCPGGNSCKCGKHKVKNINNNIGATSMKDFASTSDEFFTKEKLDGQAKAHGCSEEAGCQCQKTEQDQEQQRNIERNMLETTKLQEQSNDMDANLMPAEKFK